jgi:hypothetical protein
MCDRAEGCMWGIVFDRGAQICSDISAALGCISSVNHTNRCTQSLNQKSLPFYSVLTVFVVCNRVRKRVHISTLQHVRVTRFIADLKSFFFF